MDCMRPNTRLPRYSMTVLVVSVWLLSVPAYSAAQTVYRVCLRTATGTVRLLAAGQTCGAGEVEADLPAASRVAALEQTADALARRPDPCAPTVIGSSATNLLFTTDFSETRRSSFGSGENVHVHAPAADPTFQVRNLWFDPTGVVIPEGTSLIAGTGSPIEIGLTPSQFSSQPIGTWRVYSCYERNGVSEVVGTVAFTVTP